MRYQSTFVCGLLLAAVALAATRPIAIRVEIQPVGPMGDDTTMSITVQVAPEDRRRLGTDFWIQGELTRAGERVDRMARAVDMDENGQARIEMAWPPGAYELLIEVEGTQRGARGVWMGPITVPDLSDSPTPTQIPSPEPTPTSTPMPTPIPSSEPTPVPPPDEVVVGTAAAAAADPAPDIATEPAEAPPVPAEQSPQTDGAATESVIDEADRSAAAVGAAAAATGAAAAAAQPSQRETEPEADPPPDAAEAAAPMAAAGAAVEPVPEPTVTDERAVEAEPPTEEAAPEPSPTPAAPPSSQEATTTRSDGWPSASDTVDLTVTVTDRNRPLVGLQANAFRIRVGGRETPIVRIGDAATAPLNLGFVVALSPMTGELRSEVSRQAARFSLRIAEDRGDAFVTSSTGFSGWGMDANELAAAIADVPVEEELNVAALMAQASEAFSTRRGRSFLVIISDGSDVATKAQWKEASSAAAEAGVPIYVIGLRDSGFSSRARTSLGRTADVTGGRKYFLADPGMLEMTLDFIGELVDASYAIQINRSGASSGDNVKITGADKSWQVDHPGQLP